MKKLFLLMLGAGLTMSASAQYKKSMPGSVSASALLQVENTKNANLKVDPNFPLTGAKTNSATERWYYHLDPLNDLVYGGTLVDQANMSNWLIFQDSTIKFDGSSTSNFSWHSVAQNIDPYSDSTIFNNMDYYYDQMQITTDKGYSVDSVSFVGWYLRNPSIPGNIVDTLVVNVYTQDYGYGYRYGQSILPSVVNYGDTSLFVCSPLNGDSVRKTALSQNSSDPFYTVSIPLYASDSSSTSKTWNVGIPGGLQVPVGKTVGFSVTFRTGVPYGPSDLLVDLNQFRMMAFGTTNYMHYAANDYNVSSTLAKSNGNRFLGMIVLEALNSPDLNAEHFYMGMKLSCPTCKTVEENYLDSPDNIKDVVATKGLVAYPNPAVTEMNIKFESQLTGAAKVSVVNNLGQVVLSQNIADVVAGQKTQTTINVANLAAGFYTYNVEIDGVKSTGKFSVVK